MCGGATPSSPMAGDRKVTKVIDDDQIEIDIADDVRIRQLRQMLSEVRAEGEPVKDQTVRAKRRSSSLPTEIRDVMLYFTRWRVAAILCTVFAVCLFAVPNSCRRKWWIAGQNGRSAMSCLVSIYRAVRISCSKSMPRLCVRICLKRCVTTCGVCCARRASAYRPGRARQQRRSAHPRRAESSDALAKLQALSQPLGGIGGSGNPPSMSPPSRTVFTD